MQRQLLWASSLIIIVNQEHLPYLLYLHESSLFYRFHWMNHVYTEMDKHWLYTSGLKIKGSFTRKFHNESETKVMKKSDESEWKRFSQHGIHFGLESLNDVILLEEQCFAHKFSNCYQKITSRTEFSRKNHSCEKLGNLFKSDKS